MERPQRGWNRRSVFCTGLGALVVVAGMSWYLWPNELKLAGGTYDIAVALYRVCNQQDVEGLEEIQGKLDRLRSEAATDVAAITHLQRIIDGARAGNWEDAMRQTRSVLEDQVSGA